MKTHNNKTGTLPKKLTIPKFPEPSLGFLLRLIIPVLVDRVHSRQHPNCSRRQHPNCSWRQHSCGLSYQVSPLQMSFSSLVTAQENEKHH